MNRPVTSNEVMMQAGRQSVASQATTIEQSRAVAEVQAMIVVAQQCPRNEAKALDRAMASCRQYEVASKAFFKFPRGGETVSGESIGLAVELARCWGNINYGIMELARTDRETEMLAFAWDVEANTVSRQTFIVPHTRDTRNGPKALTDNRDIYENNANNGARRLRECIFRVLPPYLKESAKAECYATLEKGRNEKPLPARIAEAIQAFQGIGINLDRIEKKFGPNEKWTPADIAQLEVSFNSIRRREVSAEEEFPRNDTAEFNEQVKSMSGQEKAEPEQGRTDEQHGDQQDGDDLSPPWKPMVDDWHDRIAKSDMVGTIISIRQEIKPHAEALPTDVVGDLNKALEAASAKFVTKEPSK